MPTPPLTIRASEIGGCPRHLYHRLHGDELETHSGAKMRVFSEGNEAEEGILEWACEGLEVVGKQLDGFFMVGDVKVTGHCDALCRDPEDGRLVVVEAKLMGKERFANAEQGEWSQQILWQAACYARMFGTKWVRLAAQEYKGERRTFTPYCPQPAIMAAIEAIVRRLANAITFQAPALTLQEPGEFGCSDCIARFHCYPRWRPWVAVGEEGKRIADLIANYRVLTDAKKTIEADIAKLQKELTVFTEIHETDVLKTAQDTARWVETTRETLDQKALPAEIRELLTPYYKQTTSRYLRVYPKGAKGGGDDDEVS